jgi:hypothetical protein
MKVFFTVCILVTNNVVGEKQALCDAGHVHMVLRSFRVHAERCHQQEDRLDERDRSSPMLTANLLRYCQVGREDYHILCSFLPQQASHIHGKQIGDVVLPNKLYCGALRSEDSKCLMSV